MVDKIQQMVKQLFIVGRIHAVVNIWDFIKLLGKEVEDSSEDLIEYIAELYVRPDRDMETDEEAIKQP